MFLFFFFKDLLPFSNSTLPNAFAYVLFICSLTNFLANCDSVLVVKGLLEVTLVLNFLLTELLIDLLLLATKLTITFVLLYTHLNQTIFFLVEFFGGRPRRR